MLSLVQFSKILNISKIENIINIFIIFYSNIYTHLKDNTKLIHIYHINTHLVENVNVLGI